MMFPPVLQTDKELWRLRLGRLGAPLANDVNHLYCAFPEDLGNLPCAIRKGLMITSGAELGGEVPTTPGRLIDVEKWPRHHSLLGVHAKISKPREKDGLAPQCPRK